MITIKKILFSTDFSRCANQAFDHALYIANKYHAELHMLHVIVLHQHDPAYHFDDIQDLCKRLKKLAISKMTSAAELNNDTDITIKKEQRRGFSPAVEILNYANENNIDLIVMGTHGRGGISRLLLGSVTEEVVRAATCHVFTVRECKRPKPIDSRERILVPIDFSEHSKKALSYAKEIASIYGSELQLLHVIEEPLHPTFYITGKTAILESNPHIVDKSQKELKQALQDSPGPKVNAKTYISEGHAITEIAKFAKKQNTDLIVIATHGLTGIKQLLLGRVAENTIRRTNCPVFTVKAFGKSLLGQAV